MNKQTEYLCDFSIYELQKRFLGKLSDFGYKLDLLFNEHIFSKEIYEQIEELILQQCSIINKVIEEKIKEK